MIAVHFLYEIYTFLLYCAQTFSEGLSGKNLWLLKLLSVRFYRENIYLNKFSLLVINQLLQVMK